LETTHYALWIEALESTFLIVQSLGGAKTRRMKWFVAAGAQFLVQSLMSAS